MPAPNVRRSTPLTVDGIVDAACRIVTRDGVSGLSMRKLGAELHVDPMAVYHHVPDKRSLLALVTARTLDAMPVLDADAPWHERARAWALAYWELVVEHRELTLAGLADPAIAAGGLPSTESLRSAVADSGLAPELVEATTFIVVDAVHGAALGAGVPGRHGADELGALRAALEVGLDVILAGIAALAAAG